MKSNKDFQYAKFYYNNNSLLDSLWAKNWLYFAWTIEIIAIIIYVKILYFFISYTLQAVWAGRIRSFKYLGVGAFADSAEELAIQFVKQIIDFLK